MFTTALCITIFINRCRKTFVVSDNLASEQPSFSSLAARAQTCDTESIRSSCLVYGLWRSAPILGTIKRESMVVYSGDETAMACTQHLLQQGVWQEAFGYALSSLVLPFSSLIILPSYQFCGAPNLFNKIFFLS